MGKSAPIAWVFKRIRKRLPLLIIMIAANIGAAVFSVVFALGTSQVIDTATAGDLDAFARACLMQVGIVAGIMSCLFVFRLLRDRLTSQLDWDWKKELLDGLLRGDYAEVSAYHSGELVNRLNNDVKTVNEGILIALPTAANIITKLICSMAALTALAPWLALATLVAGVVLLIIMSLARYFLKDLYKRVSESDGKVSGFMQEILEKLLMVQAMDVADEISSRADGLLGQRYRVQRKRQNMSLFSNTCMNFMYYVAGFIALVFCSMGLLKGTMSFGALTAITQLVNQLQGPLVDMSALIPKYVAMVAAADRLMELEALQPEQAPAAEDPKALYAQLDGIGAERLSFSYDRDRILEDASFLLPKGTFAVITGPSGTGKSTLLKLMLGIFKADSGELFLRCGDRRIPLNRATRRLFAYVPQGNLLLSGTLRENLTIVRPDASEEEIQQAVYVSAMEEYLPQLPRGLDTVLGESGSGLSEGQAQRLAIARAVLSGAPILLLDEGTSALDAQTEQTVLQRICDLEDRTCITVTHRPAAIGLCDWDLEIRDARVCMKRVQHHC